MQTLKKTVRSRVKVIIDKNLFTCFFKRRIFLNFIHVRSTCYLKRFFDCDMKNHSSVNVTNEQHATKLLILSLRIVYILASPLHSLYKSTHLPHYCTKIIDMESYQLLEGISYCQGKKIDVENPFLSKKYTLICVK